MSVVLLFLATNSGHPISEGRGALVRRLIEQAKPCTDSSILDAFERFGPQCPDLAQAVKHLSEVVTLFGELVPQDRPEVRSHYRNLATDIAAYAPENSAEASEDTGGQPSLDPIARLERLAAMRVAGHLDEEEFKRLKASVLNSLN